MFGNDRTQLRRFFVEAWRKQQDGDPLSDLERLVADVIQRHPEYHALLTDPDRTLDRDWTPDMGQTNPFLHMGMHISLQEQVTTDRPPGILALYHRLCRQDGDAHQAEHRMMDCLGQTLWEAQRAGTPPDENRYLQCLNALLGRS